MAQRPQLEFTDGSRAPFDLTGKQTIIGRGSNATLRLEVAGVAEQHARLVVDPASGNVWIEDLKSPNGTLRNGQKLTGKQWLSEGDEIGVGGATLIFRADGVPVPVRPAAEQATMMSAEPPQAVKELIARQQALEAQRAAQAAAKSKPPVDEDDGRTQLQMAAPVVPAPAQPAAAVQPRKSTVMGIGNTPQKLPPPPAKPVAEPQNPFATQAEMPAPAVGGAVADAHNPFATQAEMQAPVVGGAVPDAANPFATQAEMQAPVIPAPRPQAKAPAARNVSPAAFDSTGWGTAPATAGQPAPSTAAAVPAAAPSGVAFGVGPSPPGQGYGQSIQPAAPQYTPPPSGPQGNFQPINQTAQVPAPAAQSYGQPMGGQPYGQPAQPSTGPQAMVPMSSQPYTPPKKGSFGSISRALEFYGQIFSLAMKHKSLLTPLVYDVLITTVLSILLCAADFFIASDTIFYVLLSVGTFLLYFIDYFCNSLTASLIYDQVTTGQSSAKNAWPRVTKALPGILTFAAVSAVLDLATTYARERRDVLSRILLDILRKIWSTATYVIMPALVIEGVPFGTAFKRSKDLMNQDPTGVGAGVVAMSITSYFVGIVMFGLAGFSMRFLGRFVHPALGMFFFFFFCNAFWAVSGWMKIAYSTCFYMWARECEKAGNADHALAPLPLRSALDAA